MDPAGQQLLAGAPFAEDEQGSVGTGQLLDPLLEVPRRLVPPDEGGELARRVLPQELRDLPLLHPRGHERLARGAEPPGDERREVPQEAGVLRGQRVEGGAVEGQRFHVLLGHHVRRGRFPGQERHLAEAVARAEGGHGDPDVRRGAHLHADAARAEEVHAVRPLSLGEDPAARRETVRAEGGGQAPQRLRGQGLQQGERADLLGGDPRPVHREERGGRTRRTEGADPVLLGSTAVRDDRGSRRRPLRRWRIRHRDRLPDRSGL